MRTTPLKGCIAKGKLMGGCDQPSGFDPENAHHVLAALSFLIATYRIPSCDKLISFYFGLEDEPVDLSKYGVVLVQGKNKRVALRPSAIFAKDFIEFNLNTATSSEYKPKDSICDWPKFMVNNMTTPILFQLFDMGVSKRGQSRTSAINFYCSHKRRSPQV